MNELVHYMHSLDAQGCEGFLKRRLAAYLEQIAVLEHERQLRLEQELLEQQRRMEEMERQHEIVRKREELKARKLEWKLSYQPPTRRQRNQISYFGNEDSE